MKKLSSLILFLVLATVAMAQDDFEEKPLILSGNGNINVENLNGKINLNMDISKLSVLELRVLRNAFAARQGYLFSSSELRGIFNTTTWYDSLCWKRYDAENYWDEEKQETVNNAAPIKYSAKESAFIDKLRAREKELLKKNFTNPNGIVNVNNLVNPLQLKEFPDALKDALGKRGFAIVEADNEQIFQVYEKNDYNLFPNFVTTDLYLQLFHLYFDTTMRKVEETTLSGVMTNFTRLMYERMNNWAKTEKDKNVKDAAEWNTAFFAVALSLISGEPLPAVPAKYAEEAKAELEKSIATENDYSTFLGYLNVKFAYALFKPRGHYTRSEQCQRYFRAMMWLQTVPFGTDINEQMLRAAMLAETIGAEASLKKAYLSVFDPITFLMGEPDNVTILHVYDVMKKQGVDAKKLAKDKKAMAAFCKEVDDVAEKQTRIRPKFERTSHNKVNLMPQRYQPDAEVLQEMVDCDNAITKRDVPMGLDVMAAMGSTAAERILIQELKQDKQWEGFTPNLERMKKLMKTVKWDACVTNNWMSALNVINTAKDSREPYFMKTPQWDKKNLNATLASWAELKHDAILYAKQPMAAECGDGSLPAPIVKGYVEPNVAFWTKAISLIDATQGVFKKFNLLTEELESLCEGVRDEAEFFLNISKKELAGGKITDEEYDHIRYIGATFENLSLEMVKEPDQYLMGWSDIQGTDKSIAVVADVYTANGDNNPQKSVLYEGVGPANEIYVIVEIDGYLYLMRGGVFSYREFKRPMDEQRMNDEEWQQKLKEYPNTGKPSWMEEIIVPLKKKVENNEMIYYGTGC